MKLQLSNNQYHIQDEVYGEYLVAEPLLVELLHCPTILRLRGIHQAGASYLVRKQRDVTRFEHSVGAMLLTRLLNGTLLEQVIALIHDVSHAAFSHVADLIFGSRDETYHEQQFTKLLQGSEIPSIFYRHGLTMEEVLQRENWKLIDCPHPDLSVDRIDYTLREMLRASKITPVEITAFLATLKVNKSQIVVTSQDCARWFIVSYAIENRTLIMHPIDMHANFHLAHAIRLALENHEIHESHLNLRDSELLDLLYNSNDPALQYTLSRVRPGILVEEVDSEQEHECHLFPKARIVDPLIVEVGCKQPVRYSSNHQDYINIIENTQLRAYYGVRLRCREN